MRLIGAEGEQLGIVSSAEALNIARKDMLDLVEVAPQSVPPVCRVMDYTKFKYDQAKKEREAKKKQKVMHLKEIRMNPNIEEHDYQVKVKQLKKFIEQHDKVRLRMTFRGREMTHMELGQNILNRVVQDAAEFGELEKPSVHEGKSIIMVFKPK